MDRLSDAHFDHAQWSRRREFCTHLVEISFVGWVGLALWCKFHFWGKGIIWIPLCSHGLCLQQCFSERTECWFSLLQIALSLYSLTPHWGCCFDQIHQTTKSHPVVGLGSVFGRLNWFFWAFISTYFLSANTKYSQHIKISASFPNFAWFHWNCRRHERHQTKGATVWPGWRISCEVDD